MLDGLDKMRVLVLQILPEHLQGIWLGLGRGAALDYCVHVAHSVDPETVAHVFAEDYEWAMGELKLG